MSKDDRKNTFYNNLKSSTDSIDNLGELRQIDRLVVRSNADFLQELSTSPRDSTVPEELQNHSSSSMVDTSIESGISNLTQLENAVEFGKAEGSINKSDDKPVSFFKDDNRVSVNKLLDIYAELSPVATQPKSFGRTSLISTRENAIYFSRNSSSSVISNKRKLDTTKHISIAKEPIRDVTNRSHHNSDESHLSSISNLYRHDSTVSTVELLNSLLNEQTRQEDRSRSLIFDDPEDDSIPQEQTRFTVPKRTSQLTLPVPRDTRPPVPPHRRSTLNYPHSEFVQTAALSSEHTAPQSRSNSSHDTFHSLPYNNDYERLPTRTFNDITDEKLQLTDSYENQYTGREALQNIFADEKQCSKTTSRVLIILSLLIPPFYILIAIGALEHRIGKMNPTHKLIAAVLSVLMTLLTLFSIGMALGFGLTHR